MNPSVPWPRCVPGESEATLALRGEPIPDSLRAMTERIISELSPLERSAIRGEPVLVENAAALRKALVCLWQLGAALALKPTAPAEIDSAAAEALLASVDSAMANLRAITEAQPEVAPALEGTRKSIANKAVSFSEALQQAPKPAAATGPRKPSGVRMLAVQTVDAKTQQLVRRRMIMMGIGLAIVVLGTASYHLSELLAPPPARTAVPSGAPAGSLAGTTVTGTQIVMSPTGKPFTQAEIDALKTANEAKGLVVRQLSPTQFLITPPAGAPHAREHK